MRITKLRPTTFNTWFFFDERKYTRQKRVFRSSDTICYYCSPGRRIYLSSKVCDCIFYPLSNLTISSLWTPFTIYLPRNNANPLKTRREDISKMDYPSYKHWIPSFTWPCCENGRRNPTLPVPTVQDTTFLPTTNRQELARSLSNATS